MTDRRSPTSDQLLTAWFEEGPTRMPDRVLDVVADRIVRQRQRHGWRLPRRPTLNLSVRLAATAVALVFFAVIGYSLLPRSGPGPAGPTPSAVIVAPSLTVTATPAAAAATAQPIACDGGTAGCVGPLTAGTYTAANFRPRLAYTVPAGWSNTYDPGRAYTLVPPGEGYSFQVLSEVSIPKETQPDCDAVAASGTAGTVADWVTFLTKNPGLTAKAPIPVTVGGYEGFRVDFARSPSWTGTCPNSVGPAVITWVRTGVTKQAAWTDDQQESFWILDVRGSTVLITLDSAPSVARHTQDLADAQPIVDSFNFNP